MPLFSIDILGLTKGTPKASDEYVAVDVTDPTMSTIGTNKKYELADIYLFIAHGFGFPTVPPCDAASTGPYTATYNNGIGGINATLTDASGTFAPFTIDGIAGVVSALTTPHPYLIKNQINPAHNGIYVLTINGNGISQPWVLERISYFNSPSNIIDGTVTMITGGLTLANTAWQLDAPGVIVVGTTNLIWNPFALLSTFITLPLLPQFGGTGIANPNTSTLTIAGPITTTGNFSTTLNFVGVTNVTFPLSGTLLSTLNYPAPGAPVGSIIISDGANWIASTSIWPNTVGIAGKIIRSNGISNVYSTSLFADTYAAGDVLISNGVNNVIGLAPSATSGIPLVSQGAGINPAYSTAVVAGGGTGKTSFTAYSVICAGTTATGAFQNVVGLGAAGNILTSNGAGALPSWQAPAASGTVNPGLINEIAYYAAPGTTLSPISPTQNDGVLVTSNTGVPSILAGPGSSNHVLMSNAASAPSWSIPTYPNASVAAGKIIISDGTNYIASTPTYPNASVAAGKIIISDGTNYVASTPTYPNTSGAAGKIIISDGVNNIYSTPTYPNASVTAGKIIISDGTNYLASTSIWPNTVGAAGKIVISDGTSNVYSTPTYPNASATLNHFIISDGTNFVASSSALNLAGNFTTTGAFTVNFTFTNNTSVTFPTTGTLATTSQIINWNNVTSTPISLVDNNGYIVNNGGVQVVFTLPATAPIGQRFIIVGHDAGGWKIAQSNVNQHIHFGNAISTVGLAGFIESTDGNDCVELICTATDNEFTVRNAVGNITVS